VIFGTTYLGHRPNFTPNALALDEVAVLNQALTAQQIRGLLNLPEPAMRATFDVVKIFSDENPADVEVTIVCNTGLPLKQSFMISEGNPVKFVVTSFTPGELACDVTEVVPAGYHVDYFATGTGDGIIDYDDIAGCFFSEVVDGNFICEITNSVQSVPFTVNKEWLFDEGLSGISQDVSVTIDCENFRKFPDAGLENDSITVHLDENNTSHTVYPYPNYTSPASRCRAVEIFSDNAVESDQGCANWVAFGPGSSARSCVITNTVFFEGIPTLSQYGMAILALLLLGMGVLGFRRLN